MKRRPKTAQGDKGFSRPPLQRMMRLHAALKSHHFPNCQKIAAELEVSPKTIQRDIDFMRDRLGLPIGYDAQKFGFYYTEAVTGFPSIEVSEGEITALFVAQSITAYAYPNALMQYAMGDLEKASVDVAALQRRRDRIVSALDEMGYETVKPQGTFYVLVRSPLEDDVAFTRLLAQETFSSSRVDSSNYHGGFASR